jgi:hypothetical protein
MTKRSPIIARMVLLFITQPLPGCTPKFSSFLANSLEFQPQFLVDLELVASQRVVGDAEAVSVLEDGADGGKAAVDGNLQSFGERTVAAVVS